MQVSVTATGGLERRLEVAVPAKDVASEVEQRLKRISRTARLKGFRPGKAPIGVVRQQFGEQVHAEVVGDLMRSTFTEAVNQEKLKPAAGPRIEPLALEPGADLKYAAVFEVLPDVKLRPVDSLTIERPVASVSETDIDTMIENMRAQRPNFTPAERAAQDGDRVTLDFEGRIEDKPFEGGQGKDVSFILGQGRMLPEFEAGVRGATAGENREVTVTFPSNYASKDVAGKTATFTLKVSKVEEQSLPAVDEEFCRAYGLEDGTIESLRTEVRGSMERELADLIRNRLRSQVLDALYRENTIEVPRALVEEQVRELQIDMARRIGAKDVNQLPARESFEQPARRRVALGLIISEIVRTEELKVDRERVQARLQDLVAAYPNPDEVRRAYLQNADAMRQVESAVLEDQVIDWVVERAKVKDREFTFKELTGFGEAK
jgi:trigger factor